MLRRWPAFLAALVLVGCLSGPAPARDARYGGVLTVGLSGGDPDSLDPTIGRLPSALVIFPALCQRLYTFDAEQRKAPWLAASLPAISKDRLTYTVELRQGVRFNDGTPFNAQAVVSSVQRFVNYPGSARATDYVDLDSVTASGSYTVVFHLKQRDATFAANAYVLSPTAVAAQGAGFSTSPVCVGPFMFDHRVVGDNVTLIKSPYYYDRGNVFLDKVVFKPMTDPAAATAALESGDIQALDNVSSTALDGVKQAAGLRVISSPQLGWQGIEINIGNKNGIGNPYTNVGTPLAQSQKLRQAFEEAIDRNAMNKVVFGGLMQATCTPISPVNRAWFPATKVSCTTYDPSDAKKLVAASGLSNPTVHLSTSNASDRLRLAQFIQAEEAAVGIKVVIDAFDAATSNALGQSGNFDARLGSNVTSNPEPSLGIVMYLTTSGSQNYSGYSNSRLDYVLTNGFKAIDPKARSVNYRVAQQIIAADRPIIFLYSQVTFAAFSASVAGVQLGSTGLIRVENARYR